MEVDPPPKESMLGHLICKFKDDKRFKTNKEIAEIAKIAELAKAAKLADKRAAIKAKALQKKQLSHPKPAAKPPQPKEPVTSEPDTSQKKRGLKRTESSAPLCMPCGREIIPSELIKCANCDMSIHKMCAHTVSKLKLCAKDCTGAL